MDAKQILNKITNSAKSFVKPDKQVLNYLNLDEAVRQGDIYIKRIEAVPESAIPIHNADGQLVPGASRGARHRIEDMSNCKLYRLPAPSPLEGPIIDASERFAVNHPEHGDFVLPSGVYHVRYQRTYAPLDRRVAD